MESLIQTDLSLAGALRPEAENIYKDATAAFKTLLHKTCSGSEWTGWYNWPEKQGFRLESQITAWLREFSDPYDAVIVCGIGGSYAGVKAVETALSHSFLANSERLQMQSGLLPVFYAGHHLAESGLNDLLDILDDKNPLVCVISKSGTTTEPGVVFRILRQYMERRYGELAGRRIVAITDPEKGSLRTLAEQQGYRVFPVPPDVGGRFSVLTAVGLVPLALAGYQIKELLSGADQLFRSLSDASQQDRLHEHPVVQLAACRKAAWEKGFTVDILAFKEPALAGLVEWWKQLFGESEGKDKKGLYPTGMQYTTDLHSLGQFLQEGNTCAIETFLMADEPLKTGGISEKRLRVPYSSAEGDGLQYLEGRYLHEINQAALEGAMEAHSSAGVPCLKIRLARADTFHLGALFAFFETTCAVSALLLGVNPFDQPGVEAYKVNLFRLMGKPGYRGKI